MKARVSLLFFALTLAACVHKYAVPVSPEPRSALPDGATIYLPTPPDGQDDRPRTYRDSGAWTASALANALRERGSTVIVGDPIRDRSEALAAASQAGAAFLIESRIAHWSDRVTEWSGIPDRITLVIHVYAVGTGEVVDKQEIKASSRWATFGGDHPQELLPELTRRWAETVFD